MKDSNVVGEKKILDACCGGRMFWFNKEHPDALYIDKREVPEKMVGKGRNARKFSVVPDKVMDFRKLDLPDESFSLVVFDPPHYAASAGSTSYMVQKYGQLDENWKEDLRKGFAECFRVLKPDGVLIFKWSSFYIPVREILELTPVPPLFGHPSGKAQKTHWLCFMKPDHA